MCDHHDKKSHVCQVSCTSGVCQTLTELDFERGIWYAAQTGDLERVQKLTNQGENVDRVDAAGYTSLHYAARNGYLEICKFLVQNGANINAITRSGCATALHRACSTGKLEVVKFLLNKKANLRLKDADGKTSLHRAAESQNKDMCELISKSCPNLKFEEDSRGKKPVDYAQSQELAEYLMI